jgi:transmembrane sensor
MNINKSQLLNFLNGNSEPQESIVVGQFLKTLEGQHLLNELLNEHWTFGDEYEIDQQKLDEWKKEWGRKFKNEPEIVSTKLKKIKLRRFLKYAAFFTAMVLAIGVYSVVSRKSDPKKIFANLLVQKNPPGTRSSFILSDGTHIFLGPGSSLTYPHKFAGENRVVELTGEAYFEVAENKDWPFLIRTNNVQTQVLGTAFKVTSFTAKSVMVAVTSGRVRVDKIEGKKVHELAILYPGEQLVYAGGKRQKSNFDVESVKSWKKGQLVFNETSLYEVCQQISRWYDVTIDIRSKLLSEETITVTLDGNMPVDKFLKGLSVSFGFKYTIHNRHIIIH